MKQEEKIIMYDSPEAAEVKTLTGWVGGGRYWGKDEHMARWSGCTHLTCECGKIMSKSYTKCEDCRHKGRMERYNALPFKEYTSDMVVCLWDGDKYFFNEEEITDYLNDLEEEDAVIELELLVCDPIYYRQIDSESVASDVHEDWEPDKILEDKIDEFNKFLETLPPHSYEPGKARTTYKPQP